MHPAALWSMALDHDRTLLAEATSARLATRRIRPAPSSRPSDGGPALLHRVVRPAALAASASLSTAGRFAIAAAARLDSLGGARPTCPDGSPPSAA